MTRPAGSSKLLRAMNESAALGHLLDPGMLTRADLRRLTALSTPTISEVLRRLTDAGLITVVGHVSGGPGPNAEVYSADPDSDTWDLAADRAEELVKLLGPFEAAEGVGPANRVPSLPGADGALLASDPACSAPPPVGAVPWSFRSPTGSVGTRSRSTA